MVMSFAAALWSSAQMKNSLSCPPGVPPFMSAYFLFCKKTKSFWVRSSLLVPHIRSQDWTLILANITHLRLGHRYPDQALIIPDWGTSGNLYLFPYPNIKKSLSFVYLFLSKE